MAERHPFLSCASCSHLPWLMLKALSKKLSDCLWRASLVIPGSVCLAPVRQIAFLGGSGQAMRWAKHHRQWPATEYSGQVHLPWQHAVQKRTALGRLYNNYVWNRKGITIENKIKVYRASPHCSMDMKHGLYTNVITGSWTTSTQPASENVLA